VGQSRSSQAVAVDDIRMQEHRNLGMAFLKTGMLDEAAHELRKVLELRPTDGQASFHLGLIAAKQRRWTDAVDCFRHAAERLGAQASVLHNLAFSYEQAGSLGEAEAAYAEAASRGAGDTRILIGWAVAALQRGDHAGAQARLDRVKEITGERQLPEMWYWARSLSSAGQDVFDEAETYIRQGLRLYPKSVVLRNNLAALLELVGEVEHAEEVLREALADERPIPQVSKNIGDLCYKGGRFDEAWDAYQRAVKLDPELGDDVYFRLGNIAFKRGEQERAGALWKTALGLNPEHEQAKANLAKVGK
jgi:Tfp pilus assembly protein PilF